MKKAVLYILILTLALGSAAGCGKKNQPKPTPTARPTATPSVTVMPSHTPRPMLPDTEDGAVTDEDGILAPTTAPASQSPDVRRK